MNVFLAGASGTIGIPLLRRLLAEGHHVTALTRSPAKREELAKLGAEVAVADGLDRDALIAAVGRARPTHVIHELTALPKDGPRRAADLEPTNRLRVEGTRHLLEAACRAGAKRLIVGSFAPLADRGRPATDVPVDAAALAVRAMESQVLEASARGSIEGIVLRYGLFYGPEVPSTIAMIGMVRKRWLPVVRGDRGQLPVIHLDDAVEATVKALDHGSPGAALEIVDDYPVSMTEMVEALAKYTGSPSPRRVPAWLPRLLAPYMARMTALRLPLSNAAAKQALGWQPRYPTMREGLAALARQAA